MHKTLYKAIISFIVVSFLVSCSLNSNSKAKYVFLFIGDGMGLNQVYLTELYKASINNKIGNDPLTLSQLPIQSYMTTYSANSYITCSSASATAMSTGFKTNNGYVCMDTSLTIKYKTIAEKVKAAGLGVGILSSVAIDHATPACFYAHQNSRNNYYEISIELPESRFDYFGGGGFHYPKGKNNDLQDAFKIVAEHGYKISTTNSAFDSITVNDSLVMSMNPELYSGGEFYWAIDKKEGSISLADFTSQGIDQLKDDSGFFMMVEGGKIDWACHGNDAATSIHETLAFDEAVKRALAFYKEHPDETLIIVTADHETGGMGTGTNENQKMGQLRIDLLQHQKISSQEFERLLVDKKAENPNISFEQVLMLIREYFGVGDENIGLDLSVDELKWIKEAFITEFKKESLIDPDKNYLDNSEDLSLTSRVIYLLNQKAGIGWTTTSHTAIPVPIRAIGVGQENFKDYIDNTDIPKIIEKVMGI